MTDDQLRNLTPAVHVVPAPTTGWRGADLDDSELVDDAHIDADTTSHVVAPLPQFVYESQRQED